MILSDTTAPLHHRLAHAVHRLLFCSGKLDAIIVIALHCPRMEDAWPYSVRRQGSGPELMILVGDQNQLPPFPVPAAIAKERPGANGPRPAREKCEMPRSSIACRQRSATCCPATSMTGVLKRHQRKGNTQISPIKWFNHNHHESHEGTSKYNEREIDMIVATLTTSKCQPAKACSRNAKVEEGDSDRDVLLPEQTRRLQKLLNTDRPDVRIMTVDSAQGCESDYVPMSCVRRNKRGQVGHVADHRRVNVAMSRAQTAHRLRQC